MFCIMVLGFHLMLSFYKKAFSFQLYIFFFNQKLANCPSTMYWMIDTAPPNPARQPLSKLFSGEEGKEGRNKILLTQTFKAILYSYLE